MDRKRDAARVPAGLDRLTEAEREALHLLGEGHTAKSIAALTGRSVAAVNERLRDARRKTGASSSRELARLLRAEKAGDEKIGVAGPPVAGADPGPGSAPSPATRIAKGVMVMSGALVIAAAAAFYFQGGAPDERGAAPSAGTDASAPVAKGDSLLGQMFEGPEVRPRRLYVSLRNEPRDPAWASRAEAQLRARYAHLPHARGIADLRITCASSLCEVAGAISDKKQIGPAMRELQDKQVNQPIPGLGLKFESASFGTRRGPDQMAFVIYWARSPS